MSNIVAHRVPDAGDQSGREGMRVPLASRDFRLVLFGGSVSFFGNALHAVALPFQILAIGGGPLQLGIGGAIGGGFALVLFPWAGALVDRWPRRRVLMATDAISATAVSAIGILSGAGLLRMEYLYAEAALLGAGYAFSLPASRAIVPEFVDRGALVSANALRTGFLQAAQSIGAAVGGIVVTQFGLAPAFLLDGLTFVISLGAFGLARPRAQLPTAEVGSSLLGRVAEGLAFARSQRGLVFAFACQAVRIGMVYAVMQVAMPVLIVHVGGSALLYGWVLAAFAGGALGGSLGAFRLKGHADLTTVFVAGAVGAGIAGVAAMIPVAGLLVLFSAGIGAAGTISSVLWETVLQRDIPGHFLGRVSSLGFMMSWAATPLAALSLAAVLTATGPTTAMFIAASLGLSSSLVAVFFNGRLGNE